MKKNLKIAFRVLTISYMVLLYFCFASLYVENVAAKIISDILLIANLFLVIHITKIENKKWNFIVFIIPAVTLIFDIIYFNSTFGLSYGRAIAIIKRAIPADTLYHQLININAILIFVREPLIAAALIISIIYYVKFCPHKSKGARIAELEREVEELKNAKQDKNI